MGLLLLLLPPGRTTMPAPKMLPVRKRSRKRPRKGELMVFDARPYTLPRSRNRPALSLDSSHRSPFFLPKRS